MKPVDVENARIPLGPSGLPLIGVLPSIWRDPLGFLLETSREYGDIVSMPVPGERLYLLNHPTHVRTVLQDEHQQFWKGSGLEKASSLLGNGLATSDGELWLRERRLIEQAFTRSRLASIHEKMVELTREMLESWQERARVGESIDLATEMSLLTQRIIVRSLFGIDIKERTEELREAAAVAAETINRRVISLVPIPESWPLPGNLRYKRALRTLEEGVYGALRRRRQSDGTRGDLLDILLEAKEAGEGPDDRQIRDEVLTLFYAGHESTANALAWTGYLLAEHPEVEGRVLDEVREVCGDRDAPGPDQLAELTYLDRVISESMRVYPPAWILVRTPREPIKVGGYLLPEGATVLISPYTLHRSPEYWADPDRFDPDHFLPEAVRERPRFAYFPFGGGPRLCIGKQFALQELKIAIAMMVRAFRLHCLPHQRIEPLPYVTLRPKHGIRVALLPR